MTKPKMSTDSVKARTFNFKCEAYRILCNLYKKMDEFNLGEDTKPAEIKMRWPSEFEGFEPKSFQRELSIIKRVMCPLKEHKGKTF